MRRRIPGIDGNSPIHAARWGTVIALLALMLLAACGKSDPPPPAPPPPAPLLPATGEFTLTNVAEASGIVFRHGAFATQIFQDPAAAMGGGLCWLDYDNDGWLDLYLVNSHAVDEVDYWQGQGGLPRNALFRNIGATQPGQFEDVSTASAADLAAVGNGCLAADLNMDGFTDLFLTADGPNALLWNNGDGTFREGAMAAGLAAPEWNSAAVAGDLNGDGWPDLFVAAYIDLKNKVPKPSGAFPQDYYGLPDHLYINNGDGTFRDVTELVGLDRIERGLGGLFSDLDRDGDLDLYIANDGHPNRLYANNPWPGGITGDPAGIGFRFEDLTESAKVGDSGSGMGVAGGDYDGDGQTDLFITNWERELNALYRNETSESGILTFQYSTFRIGVSGLGNGQTGWGTHLADFDQDTDTDLLIVNGRVPVTNMQTDPETMRYYRNRTVDLTGAGGVDLPVAAEVKFTEATAEIGLDALGRILGRGSAAADYDQDGDLDVAINVAAGQAVLLRNDGQPGNWLQVGADRFAPGLRVEITLADGRHLVRELYAGSSYISTESPFLHFGLGRAEIVSTLTAHWPDGTITQLENIAANQRLILPAPQPPIPNP
ncbi:MAG: CRTAC1 family protein [Caldilineaceae bacterium]|nr:CRTAC1 family protein [Caldilineaceae bacterium]